MIDAATAVQVFKDWLGRAFRGVWLKAAAIATVCVLYFSGGLTPADNALLTAREHLLQRPATGSIVVVEIDPQSLSAAETWPWSRHRYATAIANLRHAGAKLIGFDVDFSARSSVAEDQQLAAAIEADPGSIILPTFVQPDGEFENIPLRDISRDAVFASVNVPLDKDGRVRRYAYNPVQRDRAHASMASVLSGIGFGRAGHFLIDFGIRADGIDRISFEQVFRNQFDPERVRGKRILIGATALELGDNFTTTTAPSTPGVLVHALAYESLVQGRALTGMNSALILLAALACLFLLWPKPGIVRLQSLVAMHGGVLVTLIGSSFAVQAFAPVSLDVALPVAAQCICFAISIQQELGRRANALVEQREKHLRYSALHDPETGLPNRRAMIERLGEHSFQGERIVVAVGVDRFAMLRAAIGYGEANALMRSIAAEIAGCYAGMEVYQLSSSILGFILAGKDEGEAPELVGERILARIENALALASDELVARLRLGLTCSGEARCADSLLEQATLALDRARIRGVSSAAFSGEEQVDPRRQLALVSDVQKGLQSGEFSLLFQPKVSARDLQLVGVEALIRWRHSEFGPISPDEFIPIAEETGAIHELTLWVLKAALEAQGRLANVGVKACMSINISGRSLSHPAFCDSLIEMSRMATDLCFEITETGVINNPTVAMHCIQAFRAAGIKISVDDYGVGLSSLSYLKQIAAHELKVDKSLVQDLAASTRDRLIMKSTIDLAHTLDMSVVAEGVDDAAVLTMLAAMGCDTVQGFLISQPKSLVALIQDYAPVAGVYSGSEVSRRKGR